MDCDGIWKKARIQISTGFAAVVILIAGSVHPALTGTLVIEGTGDSQTVLRALAARYEKLNPDSHIIVPDSVGSGGGIKALVLGKAGLARTARPLKEKERAAGLTQVPFAWSPIVFAAHPSAASVKGISMAQALGVYRGDIVNWQALGGPDHKLYVVNREKGDSSRTVIHRYVTHTLGRPGGLGDAGKVFYTTGETVLAMSRNAYTLGYVPLSSAMAEGLHIFSLDTVFPDEAGIKGRNYPLVTTFYLVSPREPGELGAAFLAFVASEPAQELMRSLGVFPADKPL